MFTQQVPLLEKVKQRASRKVVMSLQDLKDNLPILQLGISSTTLVSLFLLWWQVKQAAHWHRLRAQQALLDASSMKMEETLHHAASKVGVNLKARTVPLRQDEMERLLNDDTAYYASLAFLNDIESTCLSVQAGTVDEHLAYGTHAHRVCVCFKIFQPVVEHLRKHYQDDELLIEFEKVADRWSKKDLVQRQLREKMKGVGPRV